MNFPKPRPEVRAFAHVMERVLKENDHKGGWQQETHEFLLSKFNEEVGEVKAVADLLARLEMLPDVVHAIGGRDTMERLRMHLLRELADVANVCMMLADNFGNLEVQEMVEFEDKLAEQIAASKDVAP